MWSLSTVRAYSVLKLLDSATCHPKACRKKLVAVFLPVPDGPNTTSTRTSFRVSKAWMAFSSRSNFRGGRARSSW